MSNLPDYKAQCASRSTAQRAATARMLDHGESSNRAAGARRRPLDPPASGNKLGPTNKNQSHSVAPEDQLPPDKVAAAIRNAEKNQRGGRRSAPSQETPWAVAVPAAEDENEEPNEPTSKSFRWGLLVSSTTIVLAIVVVGGVCGSGGCSKSAPTAVLPTTPQSTPTNPPTASPLRQSTPPVLERPSNPTLPPTNAQTLSQTDSPSVSPAETTVTFDAIQTPQQLYEAFDEYIESSDRENTVAARTFGYPVGSWNVSLLTDFSRLFDTNRDLAFVWDRNPSTAARDFNEDLTGWNVSAAETTFAMFFGADAFDQNLTAWDVSRVTNMSYMFRGADGFNGDVSTWNTSQVTDMSFMFSSADTFNGSLSEWNVSQVTNMERMFLGADAFNGNISAWDVSRVTNMAYMFVDDIAFKSRYFQLEC